MKIQKVCASFLIGAMMLSLAACSGSTKKIESPADFEGAKISVQTATSAHAETWLSERWSAFQTLLQAEDWRLIDAHEHTFEKRGVHCSFAALEELETFAGVPISEIETRAESGAKYRLLSVKQYLAVYKASAKDGYRVNTRGKKDAEKIALLEKLV